MLPPDIRGQMKAAAQQPPGRGGIGGAARENASAARARAAAVNPEALEEQEVEVEAAEPEKREELKVCPQPRCRADLKDEWNFCAKCGRDLVRGGPAKALGIEITEEDVHDYLFKGFILKDVKILGKHTVTLRTSQPQDMADIDDYLMHRKWTKAKDGSNAKISDLLVAQMSTLCTTAVMLPKFDGQSIGDTLEDRMAWLLERGSALVDMLSTKVVLFNQAVTEHLKKADTLLGS